MTRPEPEVYDADRPHVFVCYSHSDRSLVLDEIAWLQNAGVNLWFDAGIYAGSEWPEELANAISTCSALLFFVSPDSAASRNCRDEVQFARERSKPVVAVHLRETELPPALALSLGSTHALMRYALNTRQYRANLTAVLLGLPAESQAPPPARRFSQRTRERIGWGLALLTLAAVTLWLVDSSPRQEPTSVRFTLAIPSHLDITPDRYEEMLFAPPLAMSPDAKHVAFSARDETGDSRLYLRSIDRFETRVLPDTSGGMSPFFSADSQWIGFVADRGLRKLRLDGEQSETIVPNLPGAGFGGADWDANDTIVYAPSAVSGLFMVPASGGTPVQLTSPDPGLGELSHVLPQILPSGRDLIMSVRMGMAPEAPRIEHVNVATGDRRVLVEAGIGARFAANRLVYSGTDTASGSLWAAPFDAAKGLLTAPPARVLEPVGADLYAIGYYDISSNGSLAYIPPASMRPTDALFWIDRDGSKTPISQTEWNFITPALAPDGSRVVAGIVDDARRMTLWMIELDRGTRVRVEPENQHNHQPVWTPDGSAFVFTSDRDGPSNLYLKTVDGTEAATRLTHSEQHHDAGSFSPTGAQLTYAEIHPDTNWDIWVLDMASGRGRPLLQTKAEEMQPIVSPRGNYIAYTSNESGQRQIYLEAFPAGGKRRAVTTDGGEDTLWAPDGSTLYYRWQRGVFAVSVTDTPELVIGAPTLVLEAEFEGRTGYGKANWDIHPDGSRFLMSSRRAFALEPQINVILGWLQRQN